MYSSFAHNAFLTEEREGEGKLSPPPPRYSQEICVGNVRQNLRSRSVCIYLGHHWTELDDGGDEEGDGEHVEATELALPLPT